MQILSITILNVGCFKYVKCIKNNYFEEWHLQLVRIWSNCGLKENEVVVSPYYGLESVLGLLSESLCKLYKEGITIPLNRLSKKRLDEVK